MAVTTIRIDAKLVDEAVKILAAKSRTDAVHIAAQRDRGIASLQEADEEELRKAKIC